MLLTIHSPAALVSPPPGGPTAARLPLLLQEPNSPLPAPRSPSSGPEEEPAVGWGRGEPLHSSPGVGGTVNGKGHHVPSGNDLDRCPKGVWGEPWDPQNAERRWVPRHRPPPFPGGACCCCGAEARPHPPTCCSRPLPSWPPLLCKATQRTRGPGRPGHLLPAA